MYPRDWVSEDGKWRGELTLGGKPPSETLTLDNTSKAKLARENVKRMQE